MVIKKIFIDRPTTQDRMVDYELVSIERLLKEKELLNGQDAALKGIVRGALEDSGGEGGRRFYHAYLQPEYGSDQVIRLLGYANEADFVDIMSAFKASSEGDIKVTVFGLVELRGTELELIVDHMYFGHYHFGNDYVEADSNGV